MIKLNLTLGNSFFEHFYLPYCTEFGDILPKIDQHKIVLSQKIINYYIAKADEKGMKTICSALIQKITMTSYKSLLVEDSEKESDIDNLIAVAEKQPMKVLLAEKSEIKDKNRVIKKYDNHDIHAKGNCILNLYSLPITSRHIAPNMNIEGYRKWIANWLKDEKKIIIRDKYIFEYRSMMSLKRYYLPMLKENTCIEIHVDFEVGQKQLDEFKSKEFDDYTIRVFRCKKTHDRAIVTDNFQIVLGKGLDFMNPESNLTDECFISISKSTFDVTDDIIKQYHI